MLKQAYYTLLDWMLPPRCPMTGELVGETGALDPAYWAQLTFIQKPLCRCCGNPFGVAVEQEFLCGRCLANSPAYTSARAALKYDDASAKIILKYKHADGTLLVPLLTRWLVQAGGEQLSQCDMIIPVPLHRWRLVKRRYNQAALLAQSLGRAVGKPCHVRALERIKATESQGHKTKAARHENVQGAFRVSADMKDALSGKTVLLIDDVLTSGATVNACAKALYAAGANEVHVLTVCRVVTTTD